MQLSGGVMHATIAFVQTEDALGRGGVPASTDGMLRIPGGSFVVGSEEFYPEELPVRTVRVEEFWLDARPVTVGEFGRFVEATGYVTVPERPLDPAVYPGRGSGRAGTGLGGVPRDRGAGGAGFDGVVALCARGVLVRAGGPGSDVSGRAEHPVTQVAYEDAEAYARWAGKALPTESEWERAARGGLEGARFAWGDEEMPGGRLMANIWQGQFPWENRVLDEYAGTSPVGSFAPNVYGAYDMIGNVWEWTGERGVGASM